MMREKTEEPRETEKCREKAGEMEKSRQTRMKTPAERGRKKKGQEAGQRDGDGGGEGEEEGSGERERQGREQEVEMEREKEGQGG